MQSERYGISRQRLEGEGRVEDRKIIGITMGDPSGIGAEITVKALDNPEIYKKCKPLVIGDKKALRKAIEITGRLEIKIHEIQEIEEAYFRYGTIDLYDVRCIKKDISYGKVSKESGEAGFRYVEKAIMLSLENKIDATVTNPINKEAINLAGYHYSGHTEIYADMTGTDRYTMLLAWENLRVAHVSTHVSLKEACNRVKKHRVLEVIKIAEEFCRNIGIQNPKVGVAGLNPHCGENGLFGQEEMREIIPAIQEARAQGIDAIGPVPADTIFSKARGGWYDVVVAMYHDQGHIPLKILGFTYNPKEEKWESVAGVNITLGLPIIRTSVDHGTAFDQAGKGTASEKSLLSAIDYAGRLAGGRY